MPIGPDFGTVLAAARTGAAWAFQRLHEDLAPTVTGYLRLQGANEPDDVASETFLGVFRNLGAFTGDEDEFRSWVFTIAHRRLVDERRRRSRRPRTQPATGGQDDASTTVVGGDVEVEALAGLGEEWVHAALAGLSEDQRAVLLLRIVADLSVEDTAAATGKRPGAVRALQHRGIETLRRQLERGDLRLPGQGVIT